MDNQTQYDPQIVSMVRAIKMQESGNNYNAPKEKAGQSLGGAYQYQAPTWKQYAREILGDENAPFTPENQDKVTYGKVKQWKDQGLQPMDIAHNWNPGDPTYPQKVVNNLKSIVRGSKQYSSKTQTPGQTNIESQQELPPPSTDSSGYITQTQLPQGTGIAIPEIKSSQNLTGVGIGALGQAAQGIAGGITGGIKSLGSGVLGLASLPGEAGRFLAEKITGKNAPSGIKTIGDVAKETGISGALEAKNAAEAGGGTAMELAQLLGGSGEIKGLIKNIPKLALPAIEKDIAPALTKKVAEIGAKGREGLTKSTILGKIAPSLDNETKEIAKVIYDKVPNFTRMNTYTDKLNATKTAVYNMSDELKKAVESSGENGIYSFKQLESALKNTEVPFSLVGDSQKAYENLIPKAMDIARRNGGKISNLFNARKELDQFIENAVPNLYSSDRQTSLRVAIRNLRGTFNDFIEKRVPSVGYKKSLKEQSRMFDAIENLAPKAVKEIGTTRMERFGAAHPVVSGLIKKAATGAEYGLGIGGLGAAYNYLKGPNK